MFHTDWGCVMVCLELGKNRTNFVCAPANLQDNEIFGPVLACVEVDSFDGNWETNVT